MNTRILRRSVLCVAMGICMASMLPLQVAHAANTDGSVVGQAAAGAQITINNPETGFTRTVTASADGSYRFPFLPVGTYVLQAGGESVPVTVSLGTPPR